MSVKSDYFLAIDLGAESGRGILGELTEESLSLRELHRFPNVPLQEGDSLHWNTDALQAGVKDCLKAASGTVLRGVSCDSWGLDYVLIDRDGNWMEPTYHYRDPRCPEGVKAVHAKVDLETIFEETGIQHMPINTIYQLGIEASDRLAQADRFLMIGDAVNARLSGVDCCEESLASTSALYNPRTWNWSESLRKSLSLPSHFFPRVVASATVLGKLQEAYRSSENHQQTQVIASCSHDTACAVAATPAEGDDWAYISSGTWSLMGVEIPKPIINRESRVANFTNELGVGRSVRLLKNLSGLWLVQECRRSWKSLGSAFSYQELTDLASEAEGLPSLIDPSDDRFVRPKSMPEEIQAYCRETDQTVPETEGEIVRCALVSLALEYAETLEKVDALRGRQSSVLHIVGGGSQNRLLNQFAANACHLPVLSGPAEATAAGNILTQAIGVGCLASLAEARRVSKASFSVERVEPTESPEWLQARRRFRRLPGRHS